MKMKQVFKDVVCSFCGCLCDNLEIEVENGEIRPLSKACTVSRSRFVNYNRDRVPYPMMKINGKHERVSLEESIKKAAEILRNADRPLIYGLSSTTCETQRKCVEIAEKTGGIIDQTATVCHAPTVVAFQETGEIHATLGEIKNRSDLVIFWGCNPLQAHLNHFVRYSVFPKGMYTEKGRKERYIVAVDVRETRTTKLADMFLKITPGKDFELLSVIRALVNGAKINAEEVAGVSMNKIKELVEKMKNCRYGVIFFGLGLTMSRGKHYNIIATLNLVRDLHKYTRFVVIPMRGHFNVKGAGMVLAWQTGYPYAVDFTRGYPRYNPGEYAAVNLLVNREVDAALIVASDPVATFPSPAAKYLTQIPTIVVDPKISMTSLTADVVIPCALAGIETEGTAYRMDGVPIRLKKLIEPKEGVLPDEEIMEKILKRI